MKTIRAFGPKDLRVVERPDPIPGNGEVLIAIRACGICGSDKPFWQKEGPSERGAGHEVAGQVIALGADVFRLRVGDQVTVLMTRGCGHCPACRAGHYIRCPNKDGLPRMGPGFSELIAAPERNCLLLGKEIGYEQGSLILDVWGTPYAAIERTAMTDRDDVVVFGCGPIGLASVVLTRRHGAYVIAVDPLANRREAALHLGANAALPPNDATVSQIRRLTSGLGASIVIECSGKAAAYQQAFPALRIGGTLISVGEGACFEFKPSDMLIRNNLNVLGSTYCSMQQGKEVQDLMRQGQIDPLCFVTHRFALEELPQVFGKVVECADGILKAIVLVP